MSGAFDHKGLQRRQRAECIVIRTASKFGRSGWNSLGADIREAFVAREVLFEVLGQQSVTGEVFIECLALSREVLRVLEDQEDESESG